MKHRKQAALFLLAAVLLASAGCGSCQGLFPSLDLQENFALYREARASSTCTTASDCKVEEVACGGGGGCNSTCPHGSSLPPVVDMLEYGTPASGVVS